MTDLKDIKKAVGKAEVEAAKLAAKTDPVDAELESDTVAGVKVHKLSFMRVQVLQRAAEALKIDEGSDQGSDDMATLAAFVLTQNRATIKVLGRNPKKLLERAEDWADDVAATVFVKIVARAQIELDRLNAANAVDVGGPGSGDEGEPEGNAVTPTGSPTDSAKD